MSMDSKDKSDVGRLGFADRATRASTEPASGLGPDGRVSTDAEVREALEACVGALQFFLAFYVPYQRVLDTEAWKVACAGGVAAYHKGASAIGWDAIPYRAVNGEVHRDKKGRGQ